jgi:hypothetical protein
MYKCIFNKTTGQIFAICRPEQDFQAVLGNYIDADWIDIDSQPTTLRNLNWYVNVETRELVK